MTPRRIQRKRTKGWRMPGNTVSVTRPGRWGNPYKTGGYMGRGIIGDDGIPYRQDDRDPAVLVKWFRERMRERPDLQQAAQRELRGRDLACWCGLCDAHRDGKPLGVRCEACAPCHADVLLEIANEPEAAP